MFRLCTTVHTGTGTYVLWSVSLTVSPLFQYATWLIILVTRLFYKSVQPVALIFSVAFCAACLVYEMRVGSDFGFLLLVNLRLGDIIC